MGPGPAPSSSWMPRAKTLARGSRKGGDRGGRGRRGTGPKCGKRGKEGATGWFKDPKAV